MAVMTMLEMAMEVGKLAVVARALCQPGVAGYLQMAIEELLVVVEKEAEAEKEGVEGVD